jgi:hypothetical protein
MIIAFCALGISNGDYTGRDFLVCTNRLKAELQITYVIMITEKEMASLLR